MLKILHADITSIPVDGIVNAANSRLVGGGGVDGAIHRKGGPTIMEECDKIRARQGGCPTGSAVITTAGNLPAKFVIHAVGPVWSGGKNKENELLASAYESSIKLAIDHSLKSVSFPNISTGVYGFPKQQAAEIVFKTFEELSSRANLPEILFVCYDEENFNIYQQLFKT
jgi:O-acetyl-ADP-ribose deacetylase